MARLLFNGLRATLNGGLSSSTTTINFTDDLHCDGPGGDVPDISGGDYIPLCILDADGNLREIVHLTSYDAGDTVGTISRGEEDTGGVTHADGAIVVCSILVADVGGTVSDASTSAKGIVELATDAETATGTDATRAVTPHGLASVLPSATPDASTTVKGKVELATDAETNTGTDATRAVTPHGLAALLDALPLPTPVIVGTSSVGVNTGSAVDIDLPVEREEGDVLVVFAHGGYPVTGIDNGFISLVSHPDWVSTFIAVRKCDGTEDDTTTVGWGGSAESQIFAAAIRGAGSTDRWAEFTSSSAEVTTLTGVALGARVGGLVVASAAFRESAGECTIDGYDTLINRDSDAYFTGGLFSKTADTGIETPLARLTSGSPAKAGMAILTFGPR